MFSSWHRHPSLTFNWAGGLIAARPVIFAACAHNDARVCQQCKNNSNNNYCSPHIHPSLFNESISRSRTDLLLKMAFFTATFDTTTLAVRASYTVGTGWYHHGNLTPGRISAGRPLCLRLRLDGSIIVLFPCHCAAPRHRVLSADCIRSIPYSAVSVVIIGHRGCLRASHSRLPAWHYPWLRLEENVQYRMDILFSKCREFPSHSLALEKAVFNHIVFKMIQIQQNAQNS